MIDDVAVFDSWHLNDARAGTGPRVQLIRRSNSRSSRRCWAVRIGPAIYPGLWRAEAIAMTRGAVIALGCPDPGPLGALPTTGGGR